MPFLTPDQQRQSTEGWMPWLRHNIYQLTVRETCSTKKCQHIWLTVDDDDIHATLGVLLLVWHQAVQTQHATSTTGTKTGQMTHHIIACICYCSQQELKTVVFHQKLHFLLQGNVVLSSMTIIELGNSLNCIINVTMVQTVQIIIIIYSFLSWH